MKSFFTKEVKLLENGKRKVRDTVEKNMQNVEIGKHLNQLRFIYNRKQEIYGIKLEYINEMERLLDMTLKKRQKELKHQEKRVSQGIIKEARGFNGQLELYEHKIIIRRKGIKSFMTHGWKGNKEILIKYISSIQLKKPGIVTRGYIQFAFLGGQEDKHGLFDATKDKNTIMFDHPQEKDFTEIKEMIESKMLEQQGIKTSIPDSGSVGTFDDLEKLTE